MKVMKSATVAPVVAPVAGRRVSRSSKSVGVASERKPATPKRKTLAEAVKMFRRLDQPGFMRYGRPDDYGELHEQK